MEKPFQVALVIRQKHGVLYKAIKKRGWTIKKAAEFLGIEQGTLGAIINLKQRPPKYDGKGQEEKKALFYAKLTFLTGVPAEELFPEEVYSDEVMQNAKPFDCFVERDLATLKLGEPSAPLMITENRDGGHYEDMIATIKRVVSAREWEVLDLRYLQGMTADEVGRRLGKHKQVISLIEHRAFKRLHRRKHILAELMGKDDTDLIRVLGKRSYDSLSEVAQSAPDRKWRV